MATVRPPRIPSTPQTYRNGGGGKRKRSVLEEEEKAAEIGEGETSDAPASEEIGEESVMGTEAEAETAQGSREDRESWALLHKKTFTLHRCTPLYDLRPDWEGYARELKGYLVAEMENGAGGADDDIDDLRIGGKIVRVGFTGIELGGWRDENGTIPFNIEVVYKSRANAKEQHFHLIALPAPHGTSLDSISTKPSFQPTRFTSYPLLLLKSPQRLAMALTQWLEKQFDCRTCRLRVPPSEMPDMVERWAAGWFAKAREEQGTKVGRVPPLELTYAMPEGVRELKTITITVAVRDVEEVWERLQTTRGLLLVEAIQAHFLHHARMDLSCLALMRVGTSVAFVAGEGKIKFFPVSDDRRTARMLEWLVELAAAGQLVP